MKHQLTTSLRILIIYLLFVVALCLLASCGTFKKLRSNVKEVSKVDSISHVKTKVDSSTTKTITKTDSSGITVQVEVEDNNEGHTDTDLQITVHRPQPGDYFSPTTVGVKSNKKVKGVKVDDHQKKASAETTSTNVKKEDERKTDVKKEEKKKEAVINKKKTWFSWWWCLLALLIQVAWLLFKKYFPVPYARTISFIKKTFSMKQLILVCSVITLLTSCWKYDKPTPPRELPQGVYQEEREAVYDSVYVWNVEAKQYVKEWGIARYKIVPIKEMEVVPSGKQVMKFSYFAGYGWLQLIGIIFIAAFLYLLISIHIANDHNHLNKARLMIGKFATSIEVYTRGSAVAIIRGLAVLLIVAIGFLTLHPGAIAQNNAKTITAKQLKHYQAIDPELNYFWDSVYKAGGITTIKQPK